MSQPQQAMECSLILFGGIFAPMTDAVIAYLQGHRAAGASRATVVFATDGSWSEAPVVNLHDFLLTCGLEVTTHNVGALSLGSLVVFMAGSARLSSTDSYTAMDEVHWSLDGQFTPTKLAEFRDANVHANDSFALRLAARAGRTETEIKSMMRGQARVTAHEMVRAGFATAVEDRVAWGHSSPGVFVP